MAGPENKKPVGSHERMGVEAQMEVPVNLERVLLEAAQDPVFYRALLMDRARVLAEKGYRLRPSEQAMLTVMPQAALDKMVERLKPDKLKKNTFAKHVVTALAGSLIISTSACDSTTKGARADWPTDGGGDTVDASYSGGTGGSGGRPTTNSGGRGGAPNGGKGGAGTRPDWPKGGAGGTTGDDSGV